VTHENGETLFNNARLHGDSCLNHTSRILETKSVTTSQQTAFLSEGGGVISPDKLGYLHARTAYACYDFVLRKFLWASQHENLTKADLARRIGKSPAVVNRLLASPGNWTLETLSSLLAGICAEEFVPSSKSLLGRQPRNFTEPDWLNGRSVTGSASAGQISIKEAA
jgi:hypothetical protein